MKRFIITLLLFISLFAKAQNDTTQRTTCGLRISLLTCSPGTELYSSFGHSALRVMDSSAGTNIIFNYGTFDFDDPHFYAKFIRGKLLYFVSIDSFADFIPEYQFEQRGIVEQTLNLSCTEKQNLLTALRENAKEENKYYKYDFIHDNCTTRLRDMVARYCKDSLNTANILPYKDVSFRNLIHEYLDKSGQYWSKLGIDILLGKPLDKKIDNSEAMFLPDYLLKGFDSSRKAGQPLVSEKITVLNPALQHNGKKFFTPLTVFALLFVLVTLLSFYPSKKAVSFLRFFDTLFFFFCGVIGALLLFMWFATDHSVCRYNFNLLWALPTHLVMSPFLYKKAAWVKNYLRFVVVLTALLLLSWFFLPQQMNTALLFIAGIILVRTYFLSKKAIV